jgi:hypothetical protein
MDSSGTSFNLLAHFDSPKADETLRPQSRPSIGVVSVLKWAAAAGVLLYAACLMLEFGYCIGAEQTLSHAANAGVLEATLPRATHQSVVAAIERRLADHFISVGALQISIQHNEAPLQRVYRLSDGDRLSVALSLPSDAVLPTWLKTIKRWPGNSQLRARAERRVPGRSLPIAAR